jgi:hypothetical protein
MNMRGDLVAPRFRNGDPEDSNHVEVNSTWTTGHPVTLDEWHSTVSYELVFLGLIKCC